MAPLKIATIVGARPQFVKAAAVSRAIAAAPGVEECLIHTGQHFDDGMSAIFFRELDIPDPAYNLGIASQSHGAMTGRMLEAIERIFVEVKPDLVLVYGDTNSTLAGSLAAAKLHIPVGHVEAGLRSYNRRMPEEINRVVTDHVARYQFCPTTASVENLAREGIVDNVHHVGDVMFDATLFAMRSAANGSGIADRLGLGGRSYSVCTIHRAENTDSERSLGRVCAYLRDVALERPLVIPLHPRTRQALAQFGLDLDPAMTIEPLGYFDLHALIAGAELVYTDSGGLQKEAYFHGKPCVTLRDETEWVETIEHGWNRLWQEPRFVEPRRPITDYGEGAAAEKIVALLSETTC
jgi:UDP-GlcNAc3NAcA epimerase